MNVVKIVCVVVTYNRLEKLKKTIASYEAQTCTFDTLVIVDNNSTDGTSSYLKEWEGNSVTSFNKHIISLSENKGGSGGFYEGEKYAMTLNPDWIFVADDDAYPEEKMVEKFVSYVKAHNIDNVSAICASVVDANGNISLDHRSRHHIYRSGYFGIIPVPQEEYLKESFELTMFSYVGTLMNVQSLKKVGLVNPDLFIYADDGEHSLRLSRVGKIICLPSITIIHDSGATADSADESCVVSWRTYYLYRNQIYMYRKFAFWCALRMAWSFFMLARKCDVRRRNVIMCAIKDGIKGCLGIHPFYCPGWSIRK